MPQDSTDGEFMQAVTLEVDLNTELNFNVTYSILIKGELHTLDLKCTQIKDATFSTNPKFLVNTELGLVTGVLKGVIEGIFTGGLSL